MKKQRFSNFQKAIALAMGLASLGMGTPTVNANATSQQNTTQNQSRRDAVQEKVIPIRPVSRVNNLFGTGDANPFKHNRKGVLNQRQLRKFLRQNPTQRKKYNK